ncbi:MAG: SBBP repeat-containing protein [Bryobacterales bacterium]|nr:SBBP repeat-containing protein [Bryobacterales bacterium]
MPGTLSALMISAIYLGGAGADDCDGIAFDRSGFAYLACHSNSIDFIGAEKEDMDAFVVKFDPRTSRRVYTTRIGGSGWDAVFRIAVDADGAVWVSSTRSPDFPIHPSEVHGTRGESNAFVARLDAEGRVDRTVMIGDAGCEGLAIAPAGRVFCAGTRSPASEVSYAYVAEIPASGRVRVLTLGEGSANGVAFDERGSLFVTGFTGKGAFVSKIDLRQWKPVASVSIGEASGDRGRAVVADYKGRPHVLGTVVSRVFPGQRKGSDADVFLLGFDAALKKRRYAALFGGPADDWAGFNGDSLRIDRNGRLWIAGLTRSAGLKAQGKYAGADDGFVASFRPGHREPDAAAYFGGNKAEMLEGIATAPDGSVWVVGLSSSTGLGSEPYRGGRTDAILVRVSPRPPG